MLTIARKEMINNVKIGDRWNWKSDNRTDYLNYEVVKNETVIVPAGEFKTVLIKTTGFMQGFVINETLTWYADNIGTVKEAAHMNDSIMVRELTKYKINEN